MDKRAHFTMIRGFFLADWFTLANSFCGMGAVLAVMAGLAGDIRQGLLTAAWLKPRALAIAGCLSVTSFSQRSG